MDYLLSEPATVHFIHRSDWRVNSVPSEGISLEVLPCHEEGVDEARYHQMAMPGEILPKVELKPVGAMPDKGSFLILLPVAWMKEHGEQHLEIDGGPWNWQWPLLEVQCPVSVIRILNFEAQLQPVDILFESYLRDEQGICHKLPEAFLRIGDLPAESIQVRLSSNFANGKVRYSIVAEQGEAQRFMADRSFNGNVVLDWGDSSAEIHLTDGVATGSIPIPRNEGFSVRCIYKGTSSESNWVDPAFAAELPGQLYWGDIHVHSRESDGVGNQDEMVVRARDWQRLDFMAFNEHIEHGLAWRIWTPEKWQRLKKLYDSCTRDGEFVLIPGFEYRGFCNLWCFSDDYVNFLSPEINCDASHPYVSESDPAWDRQEVVNRAVIHKFATSPDWMVGYHRLELLREQQKCLPPRVHLLQMAHYKRPPEVGSADYLMRGDRSGFFGSTDTHIGMPGVGFKGGRNAQSGLTAVYADELSRDGLHRALLARHCYATMGSRTLLDVRLNGAMMGDEICVPDGAPIVMNIRASGSERIAGVDIVSGGKDLAHLDVGAFHMDKTWKTVKCGQDDEYFFVRLLLEDSRMAWSSPIWVLGKPGQTWQWPPELKVQR